MKRIVIFILLSCNILLNAQQKLISLQVFFYPQNKNQVETLVSDIYNELKSTAPYSEFFDKIKVFGKINNLTVKTNNFGELEYDKNEILRNHSKHSAVDIYIINEQHFFAKGGKLDNVPIIFVSHSVSARTIIHELGHALVGLGDEYDDGVDITFSKKYVSQYHNLTLNKPNSTWEKLKLELSDDLMGYYLGGLGSRSGIYHCYPLCIMQDVKDDLCPVCRYYTRMKLQELAK